MPRGARIAVLAVLLAAAVGVMVSFGESTADERKANAALDSAYRTGDFKAALDMATTYAGRGNVHAQVLLGNLYRKGEGVAVDPAQAAVWYGRAADQGDAYAMTMLGEIHLRGGPAQRDHVMALSLFRDAAQQGVKQAKLNLCSMYYREQDDAIDYIGAVKRLHMEAHMANSLAPYEMGKMFAGGAVVADHGEAARWFRMAALQGMPEAQVELGELYAQGHGVPQDYVSAHMWFNVAASLYSNVYVERERDEAIRRRDGIAAKMTADQIASAQALARDWEPTPWDVLMGRQMAHSQ